ncbi:MAG: glycoside hydrolase family 38 C-terminal domain-containing protein [Acidobacteriota bacterium]|nr:glycoside hydrolase family 38 C-terminal domain-containing protein [Acidobacteriota bacterium]
MDKKHIELYVTRLERAMDRVADGILKQQHPLTAQYWHCKDPVPFAKRSRGAYRPISPGTVWGSRWETAWFHFTGAVPKDWRGLEVVARLDVGGEGLVLSVAGEALQGLSNGSVFKHDFNRDLLPLHDHCQGGETVDFWVEASSNGLFGLFTETDPGPAHPNRWGHYDAKFEAAELRVFDRERHELRLDLRTCLGLLKTLPENGVRRMRVLYGVNKALDAWDGSDEAVSRCRTLLQPVLSSPAAAADLTCLAVGHAHIDTAWLWPVRETVRKCARTFASQAALIERYPGYVFGASQPQHYAFVKQHHPQLYDKIKELVAAGAWECQGGMWVEADCNLISGESMVRQVLHGKNFFRDEFGVDVNHLWLPDVFGYSAALPQILKKAGMDYFLTQKISWNQFNTFPHHTFRWRGIDGSEVLAHFPPENTYNSQLDTQYLVPGRDNFAERGFLDEFMSLFGVGDGGGGPKEENIELGQRMADLEGAPKVRFGKAADFFERLAEHADDLPTWVGELYLELHRGTLTTQARTKRGNRMLERTLFAVEQLCCCLPSDEYPARTLDEAWKKVLLNQFHDILPGSSINEVYKVTEAEHTDVLNTCEDLLGRTADALFKRDTEAMVVYNPSCYPFYGPVVLPNAWAGLRVHDDTGRDVPVQHDGETPTALVMAPGNDLVTLRKGEPYTGKSAASEKLVLENAYARYEFNQDGALIGAHDKNRARECLVEGAFGNRLSLYDDHPNNWDAWDVDVFYRNQVLETARVSNVERLADGPVRKSLRFRMTVGQSSLVQDVILGGGGPRLDFVTSVDWREKHKMLRTAFPVNVRTDEALFDIQFGTVTRPTHANTSWDAARFEAAGHRFAALREAGFGVALLNDCKYGYRVQDHVLDLNLLRAPNYPDPDADQGAHRFTYALLPFVTEEELLRHAASLNDGVRLFNGYSANSVRPPCKLTSERGTITLEALKRAEKEDCLIIRLVERAGIRQSATLTPGPGYERLVETNLLEWENGERQTADRRRYHVAMAPFEIRTFKLYRVKK